MKYSWNNIRPEYESKTIENSVDGGVNWETTFENGMCSYTDLNEFIHEYTKKKGILKLIKLVVHFNVCFNNVQSGNRTRQ